MAETEDANLTKTETPNAFDQASQTGQGANTEETSGKYVETSKGDEEVDDLQGNMQHRRTRSVAFVDAVAPVVAEARKAELYDVDEEQPESEPEVQATAAVEKGPERVGSRIGSILRSLTSTLFSVPLGFFTSRAEVRTWGETHLIDPAVQPRGESERGKAAPTAAALERTTATYLLQHNSLPGYPQSACVQPVNLIGCGPQSYASLAPKGGFVYNPYHPPMYVPLVKMPNLQALFSVPPPSYDWTGLAYVRMNRFPYVNATMQPANPAGMYVGANPLVAYPYGVPAVEENEASGAQVSKM